MSLTMILILAWSAFVVLSAAQVRLSLSRKSRIPTVSAVMMTGAGICMVAFYVVGPRQGLRVGLGMAAIVLAGAGIVALIGSLFTRRSPGVRPPPPE